MNIFTKLAAAASVAIAAFAGSANAGVVFSFTETAKGVQMTASGSIDVSGLVATSNAGWGGTGIESNSEIDILGSNMGGMDATYTFNSGTDLSAWDTATGPFSKSYFSWDKSGTTSFATYARIKNLRVPGLTVDSSDLAGTIWTPDNSWMAAGQSFSSLGLNAGVYTITDAVSAESLTIDVGGTYNPDPGGNPAAVPVPAALPLLGAGIAALGLIARKRKAG
jgi:hypothetical protein